MKFFWRSKDATAFTMTADAPPTLQAASGKPTSVRILAYNGGVMSPAGFPNRIIDLSAGAMEKPSRITLLVDHENKVDSVAGYGAPEVHGGQLWVPGELLANSVGSNLANLSKSGVPLQASVTIEVIEQKYFSAGKKVNVNGREFTAGSAGLYVVTKSRLREVSIVPIGADSNTSVHVAASLSPEGSDSMFKNQSENLLVATAPVMIEGMTGERNSEGPSEPADNARIARIQAAFSDMPQNVLQSDEGVTLRAQAILGQVAENDLPGRMVSLLRASRSPAPAIHTRSQTPSGSSVLAASLMLRAGHDALVVKAYGEQIADEARRLGPTNSVDFLRACIRMDGRDAPVNAGLDELLKAAGGVSTLTLPVTLSNAANKTLLPLYQEQPQWWRDFCYIARCDNFKEQQTIRPTMGGQLEEVGADGQIKSTGPLREMVVTWQASTFGRTIGITRVDWRNDDLGFFSQIIPMLVKMAARAVSDLAAKVLLANAGSFFSSGNSNLAEAGSLLSVESLAAGIRAFRERRDRDNNDLSLIPRVLAVSPKNEMLAKALLESEFLARAADLDNSPTGNPLKSMLKVVPESRLSNTAKFPNASDEHWFLFGSPSDVPMVAGFLDGKQIPTIETFDFSSDVNYLTMSTRCFIDFAFALGDQAAAYKATGEDSEET